MNPQSNSTWWKRLFTVLEIATAGITISISLLLCFTGTFDVPLTVKDLPKASEEFDPDKFLAETDPARMRISPSPAPTPDLPDLSSVTIAMKREIPYGSLLLFILIPSTALRLLRIGVIYVVEGKK